MLVSFHVLHKHQHDEIDRYSIIDVHSNNHDENLRERETKSSLQNFTLSPSNEMIKRRDIFVDRLPRSSFIPHEHFTIKTIQQNHRRYITTTNGYSNVRISYKNLSINVSLLRIPLYFFIPYLCKDAKQIHRHQIVPIMHVIH